MGRPSTLLRLSSAPRSSGSIRSVNGIRDMPIAYTKAIMVSILTFDVTIRVEQWRPTGVLLRICDGDVESDGVHDTLALHLNPAAIEARAGERHVELQQLVVFARGIGGGDRVVVDHVGQIRTGG